MKPVFGGIFFAMMTVIVTANGFESAQSAEPKSAREKALLVCAQSTVLIEREAIGEKGGSLGSGVVFDVKDGKLQILTNAHVVGLLPEDPEKVRNLYSDQDIEGVAFWVIYQKNEYKAYLVGRDPETDLAILETPAHIPGIRVAPLGNSDTVFIGHPVFACGNPYGYENAVTEGIISGKERINGLLSYEEYLQTQAPINPGNSGGPLISLETGEVIGINNSGIPYADGMGFSIPINLFKAIRDELTGTVKRSWIGIKMSPQELRNAEGIRGLKRIDSLVGVNDVVVLQKIMQELFGTHQGGGVLVAEVERLLTDVQVGPHEMREPAKELTKDLKDLKTPAFRAGLLRGDIIKNFGGHIVKGPRDLIKAIFMSKPWKKVSVKVVRFNRSGEREEHVVEIVPILRPPKSARGDSY